MSPRTVAPTADIENGSVTVSSGGNNNNNNKTTIMTKMRNDIRRRNFWARHHTTSFGSSNNEEQHDPSESQYHQDPSSSYHNRKNNSTDDDDDDYSSLLDDINEEDSDDDDNENDNENPDGTTSGNKKRKKMKKRRRKAKNVQGDEQSDHDGQVKKELKDVRNVKLFILFVLIVSILGAIAIYYQTKNTEQKSFERQFKEDANKVLSSVGTSISNTLGAVDSLASSIVMIANTSNQQFPFVTIPQYGLLVARLQQLTGAVCTYMMPVITFEERLAWEYYTSGFNGHVREWVAPTLAMQENYTYYYGPRPQATTWQTSDVIYTYDGNGSIPYNTPRPDRLNIYLPEWHKFPLAMTYDPPANWDWYSQQFPEAMTRMITKRKPTMSQPTMVPDPNNPEEVAEADDFCAFYEAYIPPGENCMEPMSTLYYPIIVGTGEAIEVDKTAQYTDGYNVSAVIAVDFYWKTHLKDLLPGSSKGVIAVFENSCVATKFTYRIDGPVPTYLGVGDFHDMKYEHLSIRSATNQLESHFIDEVYYVGLPFDYDECLFTIHVYPSAEMYDQFMTNNGFIYACSAILFIFVPFLGFVIYDRKIIRQRKRIMLDAKHTNAIVSSLFPATVRDKLYPYELTEPSSHDRRNSGAERIIAKKSIAELYPDTTVLFADIANFTVWSSARDPNQVFILLETIYGAFDRLALRRRVFKVETIGDCYVAATGLPDPRKDHAVAMVKFAKDILIDMAAIATDLETTLGPGTASLTVRVGINSGPTTAGVLRGAKGRFQLFGDTVNTAARMQSNSFPGRIMCSEKTKDLIVDAGKQHWITPRNDVVEAKGKGKMQCYWCNPSADVESPGGTSRKNRDNELLLVQPRVTNKRIVQRQIGWLTDLFEQMIETLISDRESNPVIDSNKVTPPQTTSILPRNEVSETIVLPCKESVEKKACDAVKVASPKVRQQLQLLFETIARLYKPHPFHNFEHACHVVMATKKLLSRVTEVCEFTTDQLTQIAILFSALIHDVDHPGVSTAQLVLEKTDNAILYNNQSVSEQNSVVIAWDLLMQSQFSDLRAVLMPTEFDVKIFRQVVVNSVMATDLFDKDLKQFRENRWSKAFETTGDESEENVNRRVTIVIEHIIQASDVSHTMQHWRVYQEWNHKLFHEKYLAYKAGRSEKNPAVGWYEGELWFFDNYIIPLAQKLKTCGVFGVSCDELLTYAMDNRAEWVAKGRDIVKDLTAGCKALLSDKDDTLFEIEHGEDSINADLNGGDGRRGAYFQNRDERRILEATPEESLMEIQGTDAPLF